MRRWMRRPTSLAWHVVAMLAVAVAVFVAAVVARVVAYRRQAVIE